MVHWIQARKAFEPGTGSVVFYELTHHGGFVPIHPGWVNLQRLDGGGDDFWRVADNVRLHEVVQRDDLTRCHGRPLVAGNAKREVLAFAVGPAEAPPLLKFRANVFDLEREVLPPAEDGQPEWWVFDAWVADPFSGSTDAQRIKERWEAKWRAQVEAGEKPTWD